ncbi:MAG: hypothetical protein EKK54_10930 [Neisseriaceae bacterium]|nr:MAG: hypothetical protein EKK54_10930 [Neisseriaceae bacterium]
MQYNILFSIFIFLLSSILSRKINMDNIITVANKAIINFMLPLLIFASFNQIDLNFQKVLPLINILWVLIMASLSIVVCKLLKYNKQNTGSLVISACTSEGGSIGIAVILVLQSGKFLPEFIILDVVNAIMLFSFVNYLAYIYGKNNNFKLSELRNFFISPIILSFVVAIIFNQSNILLSDNILNIFKFIGQGILPCIMVTLGANFRLERSKFIYAIIYSFLKFTAGVLIALLLIKVFNIIDKAQIIAILIISALPPSYLITVFIKENNLDETFVHSIIPISTIISVALICISYAFIVS